MANGDEAANCEFCALGNHVSHAEYNCELCGKAICDDCVTWGRNDAVSTDAVPICPDCDAAMEREVNAFLGIGGRA